MNRNLVRSIYMYGRFCIKGLVPNPNRNKLKTKKYHTDGLVPNSNRNKLKTKKYHTVGLVPNPNRNKVKTKKYDTVGLKFLIPLEIN